MQVRSVSGEALAPTQVQAGWSSEIARGLLIDQFVANYLKAMKASPISPPIMWTPPSGIERPEKKFRMSRAFAVHGKFCNRIITLILINQLLSFDYLFISFLVQTVFTCAPLPLTGRWLLRWTSDAYRPDIDDTDAAARGFLNL